MMQKLQNLKDLEYYAASISTNNILLKWMRSKPKNKELKLLSDNIIKIEFYVNQLQQNDRLNQEIISEYRYKLNKLKLK
jgi:hypothetical protein|tara:strand:+ start:605 stop:841 length:237 start_codon:yes stop_codon:yes gene_type:complete